MSSGSKESGSFLKKKNQKIFGPSERGFAGAGGMGCRGIAMTGWWRVPGPEESKVFWFFFSKKNRLYQRS
jgi:hypothetical protein